MFNFLEDLERINNKKPIYIMTIGAPCSGKSTFIDKNKNIFENYIIVSTDNIIMEQAKENNVSYNEWFNDEHMRNATEIFKALMSEAVVNSKDIIDDQTNTTAKGRKKKFLTLGDRYLKVAFIFTCQRETIFERNIKRSSIGKLIPTNIIDQMYGNVSCITEEILKNEGFDLIYFIDTNSD